MHPEHGVSQTAHNGVRSPEVGYVVREKSRVVAGVCAGARRDLVPGHGHRESGAARTGTCSPLVRSTPGACRLHGCALTWGPRVTAVSTPAQHELGGAVVSARVWRRLPCVQPGCLTAVTLQLRPSCWGQGESLGTKRGE